MDKGNGSLSYVGFLVLCSNPIVVTKSTDSAAASGRQGFNYLFYIDFVGALSNPNCQNALRHLQVRQGDRST